MGCASSKPSSSSKSKSSNKENVNGKHKNEKNLQQQQQQQQQHNQQQQSASASSAQQKKKPVSSLATEKVSQHHLSQFEKIKNEQIKIDQALIDQIDANQNKVVEYILKIVRKDLNAELVSNGNSPNFVAVIAAASAAQENDDLIRDIASRAVILIKTGRCSSTYKHLDDTLKSLQYLCKNQTQKNRICALTTETIRNCLNSLESGELNLADLLNETTTNKTEPNNNIATHLNGDIGDGTPKQQLQHQNNITNSEKTPNQPKDENNWSNAVLLSRSEANEVARMLFYSNTARPVIHVSPEVKDAYFVNKQLNENVEVVVNKEEIDQILHSFNQPQQTLLINTPVVTVNHDHFSNNYNNDNNNNNNIATSRAGTNLLNDFNQEQDQNQEQVIYYYSDQNDEKREEEVQYQNQEQVVYYTEQHVQQLNNLVNGNGEEAEKEMVQQHQQQEENLEKIEQEQVQINNISLKEIVTEITEKNTNSNENNENPLDESTELMISRMIAITSLTNKLTNENEYDNNENSSNNNEQQKEPVIVSLLENLTILNQKTDDNNNISSSNNININNNFSSTEYYDANTSLNNATQITEDGTLDPILKQSMLDDRYYNNHAFKDEVPVNGPNGNAAATTIQSSYKSHAARQEVEIKSNENDDEKVLEEEKEQDKKVEAAAITIQATFRGYKTRKEIKPKLLINDNINQQDDNANINLINDQIELETPNNINNNNQAVEKVQENISVETPKENDLNNINNNNQSVEKVQENISVEIETAKENDLNKINNQAVEGVEENNDSLNLDNKNNEENNNNQRTKDNDDNNNLEQAATKIQATYRGFRIRKDLKKDGKSGQNNQTDTQN